MVDQEKLTAEIRHKTFEKEVVGILISNESIQPSEIWLTEVL